MEHGLDAQELSEIEERFGVTFSPEHRQFLATALPTGGSWVDWRNGAANDLAAQLEWPIESVIFDVQNADFWPASWGERPADQGRPEREARTHLASVPRLVPLFSHRYIAADSDFEPSPVFSVYQTDVIYYGDNLADWVAHEFNAPPPYASDPTHVPFWSDLADGLSAADL